MSQNDTKGFAQGLYNFGRKLSMGVESGVIGLLPLILFILELVSAYAEASLVGQVMPYFEGSFTKALIYTGAGMGAGIFLAPTISWAYQLNKEIQKVNANKTLHKEWKKEYLENLAAARTRWVWVAFFCLCVAFASHGTTFYFMETAFSNQETVKLLEIKGMGEVPKALAISVTIVGLLLDFLLGSTTATKIEPKDYYPDMSERKRLLDQNQDFLNLLKDEQKVREVQEKLLKELEKDSKKDDKKDKDDDKKDDNQNKKRGKDDKNYLKSQSGTPVWDIEDPDEFLSVIFKREGLSVNKIKDAIENVGEEKFENEVAVPIGTLISELQDLYKEKHLEQDADKEEQIREEIQDKKNETLKILKNLGLNPRRQKDSGGDRKRRN